MSTGINIKKKLAILDEGASVTTDATSIDFVGSGVNASTIDGDVTITIPGGSGNTTYYLNQTIDQSPYKEFSSIVTSAVEQVVPLTVAGGVTSVIAEYQTPSGIPGTTQIPGGLWQFFLHFNAGAAGQNWIIRPTVYKRDLGGIETLLFTPDPEIVTGMSTTTTMYVSDGVFPATTLLTTDRIVVKISVENTTGVSQTVNFRTEGSQHYSVALTTLNQVIPTGAVTSVTGTAPIVSSGGLTPAISIPQATGSANGYLSSSDWSVFNAKVDKNIYTADGILAGTRTVNLAGNNLTFNDLVGIGSFTANIDDNAGSYGQLNVSVGQVLLETVSSLSGTGKYISVTPTAINIAGYYNLPTSSSPTLNQIPYASSTSQLDFTSVKTINGNSILGSGNIVAGLSFFTEAQATSAPNATVYANSLTAVASTTNADFIIKPKGTGAIISAIPDSLAAGGNKRGANAVDLQTTRNQPTNVASGSQSVVLGGYGNTASAANSTTLGGYFNTASGAYSTAIGFQSQAKGQGSFAGGNATTNHNYDFAFGDACIISAGGYYANVCMGYQNSITSGLASTVFGNGNIVSWFSQFAAGNNHRLTSGLGSAALGVGAMDNGFGRSLYGRSGWVRGDTQSSKIILNRRTTDATSSVLVIDSPTGNTPAVGNQITLQNNNVFRVKGSITGKQSASTNVGVWDIDCVIVRGTTAASTVIAGTPTVSLVVNTGGFGNPTLTANTTLGCLTVTVIGALATNIQWTCVIDTCEVIYA